MEFSNYADVVDSKAVKSESGYVQSAKKKADKIVVDFKTEYDTVEEAYNCVQTRHLIRIQADGRLEYEERCQYKTKKVAREKPAPVTLDASEAAKLEPGDLLTFLVDGNARNGVILAAIRGTRLTQIRRDRVKPSEPENPKAAASM
jgi:hypothetical protein